MYAVPHVCEMIVCGEGLQPGGREAHIHSSASQRALPAQSAAVQKLWEVAYWLIQCSWRRRRPKVTQEHPRPSWHPSMLPARCVLSSVRQACTDPWGAAPPAAAEGLRM